MSKLPTITIEGVGMSRSQRRQSLIEIETHLAHYYSAGYEAINNINILRLEMCEKIKCYEGGECVYRSSEIGDCDVHFKANQLSEIIAYIEGYTRKS